MSIFKKYGDRMIVTIVTIILIIIISITSGNRESITSFENKIGNVLAPVQRFFFDIGKSVSGTFSFIANIGNLKKENTELQKEIIKLEKEKRRLEEIINSSDILKNEAILERESEYEIVRAQVIAKDPGNWFDKFVIDKGLLDGIELGDPVVQAVEFNDEIVEEGLVGRVIEVGDHWAKVMSIIDESSKVSFKIIRTLDGGIASGSFDGKLGGYMFSNEANVIKGDKLLTSGLGGIVVEGLYIGEITEVSKESDDLIKNIKIKPAVDFKKIYKVFVITSKKE